MTTVTFEVEVDLTDLCDEHESAVAAVMEEKKAMDNFGLHRIMMERLEDITNAVDNLREDMEKL